MLHFAGRNQQALQVVHLVHQGYVRQSHQVADTAYIVGAAPDLAESVWHLVQGQ